MGREGFGSSKCKGFEVSVCWVCLGYIERKSMVGVEGVRGREGVVVGIIWGFVGYIESFGGF